jgi:hypothetical protein
MEDPRNVSATVVYNSHFITVEQPQEHPKVMQVLESICTILRDCGVLGDKISRANADGGAVCFDRHSQSLQFPCPGDLDAIVGRPCPYAFLRDRLQAMLVRFTTADKLLSIDLQYDGTEWTKIHVLHPWALPLTADRIDKYAKLAPKAAVESLRREAAVLQVRDSPGRFERPEEFEQYLSTFLPLLKDFAELYDDYRGCTYRMFSMSAEQRRIVESLGGEVLPNERGMCQFRAPTAYLKKDVRNALKIDRIGWPKEMNRADAAQITAMATGWRGEPDFEKKGRMLITFPYRNEKHKAEIKANLAKVLKG